MNDVFVLRGMSGSLIMLLAMGLCQFSSSFRCIGQEGQQHVGKDDTRKSKLGTASFLIRGTVHDNSGNPVAGAILQSFPNSQTVPFRVVTNQQGSFVHRIGKDDAGGISFLVTDSSGKRSSFVSGYDYRFTDRKPFAIVLQPPKQCVVAVVGTDDQPIVGATISAIAPSCEVSSRQTDESGKVKLDIPWNATIQWIAARKSGEGFDYYENQGDPSAQKRLDVPSEIQLRLSGAKTVSVTTTNANGERVSGVMLMPWLIKKKGKARSINLPFALHQKSDAAGRSVFDWIPVDFERPIEFIGGHPNYFAPRSVRFNPWVQRESTLVMKMVQLCPIRGKVTYADGAPAAGIRIQAEGRGTEDPLRAYTSTAADGAYEIKIHPEEDTIIAVTETDVAAASKTDIRLAEGKSLNDIDFVLVSGTTISGVITMGADRQPVHDGNATLIQQGDNRAELARWSFLDQDGRYCFRVGPGKYTLQVADAKRQKINIESQKEWVFDHHSDRVARLNFSGRVVDENGMAAPNVEVLGSSISTKGGGFKSVTDAKGEFKVERWNASMSIYAVDSEKNLLGHHQIDVDQKTVDLILRPAGTVKGRVVNERGESIKGVMVILQFGPPAAQAGAKADRILPADDQGRFTFRGVPIGSKHMIGVVDQATEAHSQRHFEMTGAGEHELEPIVLPSAK